MALALILWSIFSYVMGWIDGQTVYLALLICILSGRE